MDVAKKGDCGQNPLRGEKGDPKPIRSEGARGSGRRGGGGRGGGRRGPR